MCMYICTLYMHILIILQKTHTFDKISFLFSSHPLCMLGKCLPASELYPSLTKHTLIEVYMCMCVCVCVCMS
jgi:hypothetical protein